jgi:lysophospholipase L1-like esterase
MIALAQTRFITLAALAWTLLLLMPICSVASPHRSQINAQRIEDATGRAMLSFYRSLAEVYRGESVARILHYGDSHIAADILTGTLRRTLQSCLGDAGAGFILPVHPWPYYSRTGVTTRTSDGWHVNGLKQSELAQDNRVGLAGVSISTDKAGEWVSATAFARRFEIHSLKQPAGGAIDVLLDGKKVLSNYSLESATSQVDFIEVGAGKDSLHTIEIRTVTSGRTRILGIATERSSAGIIYDALGINGARASRPTLWNPGLLASSIKRRDPDLIVVSYGSNEVSDLDLDLERYSEDFASLLDQFYRAAPRASILVISPPDRAARIGNRWQTFNRMAALIEAQRRAAIKAGAAFYDLFNAMGGTGSIQRWASEQTPLARPDRVHLTTAGYRLVAEWLYAELMRGFLKALLPITNNTGERSNK